MSYESQQAIDTIQRHCMSLEQRIEVLEKNSHEPIDLNEAIIEILSSPSVTARIREILAPLTFGPKETRP